MSTHKKYLTEEERLQARRETKKRWEEAHKEERKEYFKKNKAEYYKSHKEKIAEYCQANKEKRAAQQAEWYQENRDKKLEYIRQWKNNHPIENRANYLIQGYKKDDKKYNRGECTLTSRWIIDKILFKPCAHCGKKGWDVIGCNRLDNSKPHTENNVEPCCFKCNVKISGGRPKNKIDGVFD